MFDARFRCDYTILGVEAIHNAVYKVRLEGGRSACSSGTT